MPAVLCPDMVLVPTSAVCKNAQFMGDEACAQKMTSKPKKTAGSQLAVSPSYQLTYASIPYQVRCIRLVHDLQWRSIVSIRCSRLPVAHVNVEMSHPCAMSVPRQLASGQGTASGSNGPLPLR